MFVLKTVCAVIILGISFVGVSCEGDTTLNQLPDGISAEILSILANGTVTLSGGCGETQSTDVKFFLHNRINSTNPTEIDQNRREFVDSNKPVILIVHGWTSSASTDGLLTLKDAYLQRYDANVIAVDWSELASQLYTKSFCNLPGVGEVVGNFLCALAEDLNMDLGQVHILGHSMGAQICGIAGQTTQAKCSRKVGRITGLDPAGPLYQGLPINQRLDKTDAEFVDIVHTNAGQFGYVGATGTVDFYVNCGSLQPQCPGGITELSVTQVLNLAMSVVTCPHTISWYYMAESVNDNSDKFKGVSCTVCKAVLCAPDLLFPSTAMMGENSQRNPKSAQYINYILREPLYKV